MNWLKLCNSFSGTFNVISKCDAGTRAYEHMCEPCFKAALIIP